MATTRFDLKRTKTIACVFNSREEAKNFYDCIDWSLRSVIDSFESVGVKELDIQADFNDLRTVEVTIIKEFSDRKEIIKEELDKLENEKQRKQRKGRK